MNLELDFITVEIILAFILIMARLLALSMTAPVISRPEIPAIIKIGFAAALSLSLYSYAISFSQNTISANPWLLTIILFFEIAVGALIGFTANLIFHGIQTFAQVVGVQMGQSSANIFDPATRSNANPAGLFYLLASLTLFLIFNGLANLLSLLSRTFEIIPIASFNINFMALATNSVPIVNEIFIISLKFMLPILAALILIDIFVALVAKILPQANMYFLIMPNKLILGAILVIMTFSGFANNLELFFQDNLENFFLELFS